MGDVIDLNERRIFRDIHEIKELLGPPPYPRNGFSKLILKAFFDVTGHRRTLKNADLLRMQKILVPSKAEKRSIR